MKIAVVGLGGVGSNLAANLSEVLRADIQGIRRINPLQVRVFDGDTVEEKNLMYANYDIEDLGKLKTDSISRRYAFAGDSSFVTEELAKKIAEEFDFVILCVDSNDVRRMFYDLGVDFLDLRATGKFVGAFLVVRKLPEYEKQLPPGEEKDSSSCQFKYDIESRTIRFGNRVVAEIGLSLLQNYLLGDEVYKEKILSL